MKTREVTVKFLDTLSSPTKEECEVILKGHCPNCEQDGQAGEMVLETADEFTDFYACNNCDLHIHSEVLETILGRSVYRCHDVMKDLVGELTGAQKVELKNKLAKKLWVLSNKIQTNKFDIPLTRPEVGMVLGSIQRSIKWLEENKPHE